MSSTRGVDVSHTQCFCSKSAKKKRKKVEVASGPSSCPCPLQSRLRFDGGATCPRPRQLFHHERHLSHRASSSRKLQLKPKATTLSDMYPGGAGMNSAISARSLLNPKSTHSLSCPCGFEIIWRGQIKGQSVYISSPDLSSYLRRKQISS